MNRMSGAQQRKIYVLAKEKGLDNEMLHAVIHKLTKKESMTQLNISEAIKVIDCLEGKKQTTTGMITEKQKKFITGLAKDIGWVDEYGEVDDKRLGGFLYSRYGISALDWLTTQKASDAIEGLKAIKGRMKEAI